MSINLNIDPSDLSSDVNYVSAALETFEGEAGTGEVNPPTVGMVFPNGDDFGAFCYTYAYKSGFELFVRTNVLLPVYKEQGISRRSGPEKQPKLYMMSRIRLQCKKGGRECSANSNVTGCNVFIDGTLNEDGLMSIRTCNLEHNHPIDSSYSRFMVSFREIGTYFKSRMMNNDAAGITIISNFHSLALECGGEGNLPFNSRDMRNCINQERRLDRLTGDVVAMLEYFEKVKKDNPDFFYVIDTDTEGRLTRIFWADARCRSMCKVFGDVVTFDTTFLSNRYGFSFAPFIGVNQHGSTICLAAALIEHEDADSFIWIFERWLQCMEKPPSVILTDQCRSIGKAVKTVFPNTPHRLCLWHILRNAAKNLGAHKDWKKIEKSLGVVVHESLDEEEFDEAWSEMIDEYNLHENKWIKDSGDIRKGWVPAYWRGVFCAGMSSTQRSEQSNRFFKLYVSVETGLLKFVTQFEEALKAKVEYEGRKNFECNERPRKSHFNLLVEDVFYKIYTNDKYKEVQNEALGLIYTNVTKIGSVGSCNLYVADEQVVSPVWRAAKKSYQVSMDSNFGLFTCACKLFEFKGILCKHIIRCIVLEDIKFIPGRYILDRWRKDIVRGYEHIRVGYYDPGESVRVKKAMEVKLISDQIHSLALQNDECLSIFKKHAENVVKELQDYTGTYKVQAGGSVPKDFMVFSRRRLQPREQNQRHIVKNVPAPQGDMTKDPVDKRKRGRACKVRQKSYKKKKTGDAQPSDFQNPTPSQNTPGTTMNLSLP